MSDTEHIQCVWYKLNGKSHDAAHELYERRREFEAKYPIKHVKPTEDIVKDYIEAWRAGIVWYNAHMLEAEISLRGIPTYLHDWRDRLPGLLDRNRLDIFNYNEELMRGRNFVNDIENRSCTAHLSGQLGMKEPVITVHESTITPPRAYYRYPVLTHTLEQRKQNHMNNDVNAPVYMLACPVGYDDKHFIPEDAERCMIVEPPACNPMMCHSRRAEGVQTPDDFRPAMPQALSATFTREARDLAAREWQQKNNRDQRLGITPPPTPGTLRI